MSGKNCSSFPLELSTTLLATLGDTLAPQATPRIRFIFPWSRTCAGLALFLTGHLRTTWPPPPGAAPLLVTVSSKPVSSNKNLLNTGRQDALIQSGEGSTWLFVTPVRIRCSGFLQKGANARMGSSQYPIPLDVLQSCSTLPPSNTPGWKISCVPVSFTSTLDPFVILSSSLTNPASASCSPGSSSRGLIFDILTVLLVRVARTSLCLK